MSFRRRTDLWGAAPLSLHSALLVAAFLLLVALAAATELTLRGAYEDEVQLAFNASERTAQKLGARVKEVLDQVDQTTLLVKSLHEAHNRMDLKGLRSASLLSYDVIRAVLITDRLGRVQDSTTLEVPRHLADGEDFKRHARYDDPGLTLGLPEPDLLGGGLMIPAMRSLARDAAFDGVVVALIDLAALTQGFGVGEAPGTEIGVLGLDNIYRARLVNRKLTVGDKANGFLEQAQAVRESLKPALSPVDGVPRFLSVVPVDDYPLYAVVAISADSVLARYDKIRLGILSWAAAIAVLLVSGAAALWTQARRLDESRSRAHRAEAMYRATSEGSLDALFMLGAVRNAQGDIEDFAFADANTRGQRLLGRSHDELVGASLLKLISERLPALHATDYLMRCKTAIASRSGFEVEVQMLPGDPDSDWLHVQTVPLDDGIAIISRDVSEDKAAQRQLVEMARLDPLTQLSNRRHFEEQLVQAAARARRSQHPLALVYLDLDGFKQVNDTLGHGSGDQLLVEVAKRLKASVRTTDLVSRLGGDEFTVMLEESGSDEDRHLQCQRLLDELSRPHVLGRHSVVVTPSLGVAVYRHHETLEELHQRADAAMYAAKRAGKAQMQFAA